jgi:hypothetical protein
LKDTIGIYPFEAIHNARSSTEEAVELLPTREEAEAIVQAWDRDERDQAGMLRVEPVELLTGTAN